MTFVDFVGILFRHHDYFHFIAILSCWFLTASLVVVLFLSTTDFINFTPTIYLLFRTNQTFPFRNLEIFSQLLPTGQNFFSLTLISAIQIRTSIFFFWFEVRTQRCHWVFKSGWTSSNVVGIICPMVVIELTELQNSGWAKVHPAHPLATSLPSMQIEQLPWENDTLFICHCWTFSFLHLCL